MIAAIHRLDVRPSAVHGFSLIELIITVAVLAVLVALAVPSFREVGMRMAITGSNNEIVGALNMARAEAAKRGLPVGVISLSGGGDWSSGWEVVASTIDPGGNVHPPAAVVPCTQPCITSHGAVAATYTVEAKATGGGGDDRAVFDATGALQTATRFDVNVCRPTTAPSDPLSRWISVMQSGQISSQLGTGLAGDAAGSCGS